MGIIVALADVDLKKRGDQKMTRKRVDIEKVLKLKAELAEINSVDIEDIDFYENGEKLHIPHGVIVDFKYIGLSNADFVTNKYHKTKIIWSKGPA